MKPSLFSKAILNCYRRMRIHDHLIYIGCPSVCVLQYILYVEVSLAIRGGYVPGKFSTVNTKTPVLSLKRLNLAKNGSFPSLFAVFKSANSQNRAANTKPANSEGRL